MAAAPNGWRAYVVGSLPGIVMAGVLFGILQERVTNNTSRINAGILPDADRRVSVLEDDAPEIERTLERLQGEIDALENGSSGDRYTETEARRDLQNLEIRIRRMEDRIFGVTTERRRDDNQIR